MHLGGGETTNGFFRYLTWSQEDEGWQIVCTDAGHNEVGPRTVYPPDKERHPQAFKTVAVGRTLAEYQLIYITNGSGTFESGGKTWTVAPGTIMIVLPGVRHHYKPDFEVGWTEYWVGFKGPHADRLRIEGFLSPRRPVFQVGLQNALLSLFEQVFELVQNQQPLYQARASARVLTLIAEAIAHERRTGQHSSSESLVERARFMMEENLYRDVHLDGFGEMLGVSTAHLTTVFKSYTSMTPYQYFISIKIRRAKELLEEGALPVKEVAFRLGFEDPYYFSRLFRKKTGIAPSRWSAFVNR